MNGNNRNCIQCNTEISACMGIVLARDWIRLINGEIPTVRELCGKCGLILDITGAFELIPPYPQKMLPFTDDHYRDVRDYINAGREKI